MKVETTERVKKPLTAEEIALRDWKRNLRQLDRIAWRKIKKQRKSRNQAKRR